MHPQGELQRWETIVRDAALCKVLNLILILNHLCKKRNIMQAIEKMEPMSAGRILDRSLKLYSRHWSLLLGISAVLTLPLAAAGIGIEYIMQAAVRLENIPIAGLAGLLYLLLLSLQGFVIFPWAQGASTYAISECYLNREVSIGQAIGFGWSRLGTLFNVSVSVGLRLIIGLLLFIIPGIVWACSYVAAMPAVIIEGCKAKDGMRRSRELAKGRRWSVFAILITIWLLSLVVTASIYFAVDVTLGMNTTIGTMTLNIASQGVTIFLMPLGVIAATLLYYDFRIRKEGFDLELLQVAMHADSGNASAEQGNQIQQGEDF